MKREQPKQENDYTALLKSVGTKQQTLEEAAEKHFRSCWKTFNEIDYLNFGAKWQQEQDKKMYSEEDMIAFGKSCFYKGFDKAEKDDANCYTAFREEIGNLIKQFKNK